MVRPGEDRLGRAGLDDLAGGHHADPLGHLAHDRQVVGDQQQRHAEAVAQILEKLEDLRLDGHVERGRRLVGDQDVGFVGDRHRDHDPLALAARELVRVGVEPVLGVGQADQAQELEGAHPRRPHRHPAMHQQGLGDLLFQRVQRVERGHRLLKDDRDAVAADPAQRCGSGADQLLAGKADAALRPVPGERIGQQLQDRERGHGLARAAFADQRQGLAAVESRTRRRAPPRPGAPGRAGEGDAEIADFEERRGTGGLAHQPAPLTGSPCAGRTRRAPPRRQRSGGSASAPR